jgi:FAD/FMN-containing dehydrogenase
LTSHTTRSFSPSPPPPLSTRDRDGLAAEVGGPVLLPGDDGYAEETTGFNVIVTHRPAVIVGAKDVYDVQAAVRFANAHGLPVGVVSTGHGPSYAIDDAVLITTHRMTGMTVDATTRTARVEAGVRWEQAVAGTTRAGLAPLPGSSPTVGVVGYTLGGGLSVTMGRAYGWAADHVRSIEVVTADGELHQVSDDSEAQLFWALRGGKSNFGVVTSMEFALFPVARLYAGSMIYAGEHAAAVLHAYQRFAARTPDEVTSSVALLRTPDVPAVPALVRGKLTAHVRISYLGSEKDGRELIAPLREAAPTLADDIRERPYGEFAAISPNPPGPMVSVDRFANLDALTPETVEAILAVAGPGTDCRIGLVDLRQLGGALSERTEAPNAVVNRTAGFVVFTTTQVAPAEAEARAGAGLELMERLEPWLSRRRIPNFLAPSDATVEGTRGAYDDATYERLRSVKTTYDPRNVFRFNHNIPPHGST